jgi:hypothetical protein
MNGDEFDLETTALCSGLLEHEEHGKHVTHIGAGYLNSLIQTERPIHDLAHKFGHLRGIWSSQISPPSPSTHLRQASS